MRIVFMGTPDFAVSSLERLIESRHEISGVVTTPDKEAGRGRKKRPSPVKQKAVEHGIPVLQPEDLRDPDFLNTLRSWAPDLQVVVAFRLLPKEVWSIPPYGTINLHASLLPAYRGAAPIQRAIMNGERSTGVSTFFIEEGMDKGDILLQESTDIPEEMTAGELHDRLMDMGAESVLRTVNGIEEGDLDAKPQGTPEANTPTRAPKLTKKDRKVDWKEAAKSIHDRIRAMSPYPGVQCGLRQNGQDPLLIKILRTQPEPDLPAVSPPGSIQGVEKDALYVATGKGLLVLLELQPAGGRRMGTAEFMRGYRVQVGDELR